MTTTYITQESLKDHNNKNEVRSSFGKTDSLMSEVSNIDEDESNVHDANRNLIVDIIKTENDLAGFSILWSIGCIMVIILRITEHPDVVKASWVGIFIIPILICTLTWIFSYVITIYRRPNSIESMKIAAFFVPFVGKISIATVLFGRLMYASGGLKSKHEIEPKYNGWCDCSIVVILICLVLSVITTEIIITTVMVNSSQNLVEKVPRAVDLFLFITRPILWVYNRLIVMFITFYVFYFVFALGPFCVSYCTVTGINTASSVGVKTVTLPFHSLLYLFNWKPFDLSTYEDSDEVMFAVIQQVLITTTIFDLLMDIWSVWQIFKRHSAAELERIRQSVIARVSSLTEKTANQLKTITEEIDMEKDIMNDDEKEEFVSKIPPVPDLKNKNKSKSKSKSKNGKEKVLLITDDIDLDPIDVEIAFSDSDEVDPNDTPRYNMVNSDSIQKKKNGKTDNKIDTKPKLAVIQSDVP